MAFGRARQWRDRQGSEIGAAPVKQRSGRAMRLIALFALLGILGVARSADIEVIDGDGPEEGFNAGRGPDLASSLGGNPGTTLGEQRLIAFRHAAAIWAGLLHSPVPIRIDARFDPLPCDASSAVLGQGGTNTVHRDFRGARVPETWYVQALANALAGRDLAPGVSDIDAEFNRRIGTSCAFPEVWYYGLDGAPPGTAIDFVTVVLHEIAHGLGFVSLVDVETGQKFMNFDDAFMRRLQNARTGERYPRMTDQERVRASRSVRNLRWVGGNVTGASTLLFRGADVNGHVMMYAPRLPEPGSSVSHFSNVLAPNQLMEPVFTGPDHVPELDLPLLLDLGWRRAGPDLAIDVLDFPDPVPRGQILSYVITVRNLGTELASGVTLTDTLPAGVEFLSAIASQGVCSGAEASTLACVLGELPSGAAVTLRIVVRPHILGILTHTATVTGERDTNPANNAAVDFSTVGILAEGASCDGLPLTQMGSEGRDLITGTPGADVIDALGGNDVIDGLEGDDHICAGAGRDKIRGGLGNDFIFGQAGDDRLFGGAGRDRLHGGKGSDRCRGGPGRDRAPACEALNGVP